jgi:hypothetical protein
MNYARRLIAERMKLDSLAGPLIFGLTFLIFLSSPVRQVTDSKYSMVLSQSLLNHGSFRLDEYALPRDEPEWYGYYFKTGPYQLEASGGHVYYHLPPGSSLLSAPFVFVLNLFGLSAIGEDGSYHHQGEVRIQAILAALLMAVLASLFFYTARLMLPTSWSVVIALSGALGTQVYSTASRGLWSHTWGILLLGVVIFLLLKHETQKRILKPILLASLLSWLYFVRPTFAVHIFAISVYLFIFHRRLFLPYAITGAMWLAGFVIYSWIHFRQLLPSYYNANRLQLELFWEALAGNLISPARGLLIYVPTLFFVAYLLMRYRCRLAHQRLVWLSLAIVAVHLAVISCFGHWWGGHSFGARFTTDLVSWFVLLAILGLSAMLDWRSERAPASVAGWRAQLAIGGTLLFLSVFINARGATSRATWLWNSRPLEVSARPERLWDWRQPQFLAGYLPIPLPRAIPPLESSRIDLNTLEAEKYLWYGWSVSEQDGRWTSDRAAIVFRLSEGRGGTLRVRLMPLLARGRLDEQAVRVSLNNQPLLSLSLREPVYQIHSVTLPNDLLREENVLRFDVPGAVSPQELGLSADARRHGVRVQWIEIDSQ